MQFPLENRKNKNSQNVCLSQIRKNIFSQKFLLIQYLVASTLLVSSSYLFLKYVMYSMYKNCVFIKLYKEKKFYV